MPCRRTFATGILPFAHSMLTALRHPASACQQRRLSGHGQPLTGAAEAAGHDPHRRLSMHSMSDREEPVGGTRRSRCTLPATHDSPSSTSMRRQSPPATSMPQTGEPVRAVSTFFCPKIHLQNVLSKKEAARTFRSGPPSFPVVFLRVPPASVRHAGGQEPSSSLDHSQQGTSR